VKRIGSGLAFVVLLLALAALGALGSARTLADSNRLSRATERAQSAVVALESSGAEVVRAEVAALAQHPVIFARVAGAPTSPSLIDAVLLQARRASGASIVYVMDRSGLVRDCSTDGPSLVGQRYDFRPYFSEAMAGRDAMYGAQGVTTNVRGFYLSSPIGDRGAPLGAVVAKLELADTDRVLATYPEPMLLLSPDGVVFSTNRPEWMFRSAWPLSAARRAELLKTRQFADAPLSPLPFDVRAPSVQVGDAWLTPIRRPLGFGEGWSLVLLDPERHHTLTPPQVRFLAGGLAVVTLMGALLIALLLTMARRMRAEANLARTEADLAQTLDSIGDAVVATDATGHITRLNPAATKLTGWSATDALGQPIEAVLQHHEDDPPLPLDPDISTAAVATRSTRLVRRDGTLRHVAESVAPIQDASGTPEGVVLVLRDVSEEVALRAQLQQAQKLEAVGQLAGGVAHDFNNLLTAIMGNAELLRRRSPELARERSLEEIVRASSRAAELTRQLLTFSRKGRIHSPDGVDLHVLIDEVRALLERSIESNISLVVKTDAEHHTVQGDPAQLQSALLNLCLNSRDALPHGGTITLATRNLSEQEAPEVFARSERPPLEIAVSDDGIGIPAAHLDRIFEPFFTTKDVGRGTGLGLAAVYGCVKGHGGTIEVESAEGVGSTFRVVLPTLARSPNAAKEESQSSPHASATGLVIVADDEPAVRELTAGALRSFGYEVIVCSDGADAVSALRDAGARVSGMVLDLVMPHLGGDRALVEIRRLAPDLPVLLTSGYARTRVEPLLKDARVAYLAKPFRLSELSEALKRLGFGAPPRESAPRYPR